MHSLANLALMAVTPAEAQSRKRSHSRRWNEGVGTKQPEQQPLQFPGDLEAGGSQSMTSLEVLRKLVLRVFKVLWPIITNQRLRDELALSWSA